MKTKTIAAIAASLLVFNIAAYSVTSGVYRPNPYTPGIHYRFGGPRLGLASPHDRLTALRINPAVRWGWGNFCDSFDPNISFNNLFNLVANGVDRMATMIVQSGTGAVTGSLAYGLKQSWPSAYEFLTTGYAFVRDDVNIGFKRCRQYHRDVAANKNPYDGIFTAAFGEQLKVEAGAGGVDILTALSTADEKSKEEGFKWLGGYAGGTNTEPAMINRDTARAGYQMMQEREPTSTEAGDPETSVGQVFPTMADAENFIQDVLGDVRIKAGEDPEGIAGVGIIAKIDQVQSQIMEDVQDMIDMYDPDDPASITVDDLDVFAGGGITLARNQFDEIMRKSPDERDYMLEVLASKAARGKVQYDLFLAKQMLMTGRRVPEIESHEDVQKRLDRSLADIDGYVNQIKEMERHAQEYGKLPLVMAFLEKTPRAYTR